MVVNDKGITIEGLAKTLAALGVIAGTFWTVGAFIGLLVWRTAGESVIAAAGVASASDVARIESSISIITRQLVVLARPDNIVLYRDVPHALNDQCRPGQPCPVAVYAERDPRAIECEIIPGTTELLIYSGEREYRAPVRPNAQTTNLAGAPRTVEPVFIMPQSLPLGSARGTIRTTYTDCLWQIEGEPPAVQDSPVFDLEIVE
jgi:hypothetical protein